MISEFLSKGISLGSATAEEAAKSQEQFLRFHLAPDFNAALPVEQMTEVFTVSTTKVVPIPHMPAWVIGVYNWRGEILWLVDLGYLLGGTPLYQQADSRSLYTAIVVNSQQSGARQGNSTAGKKMLGLAVNRVEDMEWFNSDLIQSPPESAVSEALVPFLRGYWLKNSGEIVVVLDGNSIIAGMPK
ncbi:MAG: chemotaxis protein CheW [Chroococcus sp. CMT-3BRIN-NPC107]|jgi:positive phototaxis protein PixI|nr:chemotaxis protein CheW [Chroococcus sp. CMT-3BRIN-NPC107]